MSSVVNSKAVEAIKNYKFNLLFINMNQTVFFHLLRSFLELIFNTKF